MSTLIEGRNPVYEALVANSSIEKIYLQKDINRDEKIREILHKARKRNIRIERCDRKKMDGISKTKVHQGVIAVRKSEIEFLSTRELLEKTSESKRDPFFVIVREVLYDYNLGAIIRTAVSAGVNGIIIPHETNISSEVIRGSMGATEHALLAKDNIFQSIKYLRDNAIKVVGIEVSADKYYYEEDLTGPICLIIGGEDHSLSEEIKKKCDFFVKIPLFSPVNSLNMSVASGIVIYDKVRQELSK